ncbi:ribonuclease P protein component, partial [Pusillimonas sp.]|uniref:ribonuclease P protein component n=1 Tax=Pusillimonas sp. TaxID=3040095 RepID=UPI0037C5DC8C
RGALLVVSTPREHPEADAQARLGMIIAKRFAARAVTRNTIKRVIREAFRQRGSLLPPRDFVFRLHSPVAATSLTQLKKQLRAEVDTLLDKMQAP